MNWAQLLLPNSTSRRVIQYNCEVAFVFDKYFIYYSQVKELNKGSVRALDPHANGTSLFVN